jgi:hypothetical protein
LGNLNRMISLAEVRAKGRWGTQRAHRESLGEMERKRSYRKDTMVLALPELAQEGWKRGMGALRSKRRATGARPCPFHQWCLQQARGTETGDRIGYLHWLTLKNPARHRNPQCRISQMPKFHKIAPHAGPIGERLRRSRRGLTLPLRHRQV